MMKTIILAGMIVCLSGCGNYMDKKETEENIQNIQSCKVQDAEESIPNAQDDKLQNHEKTEEDTQTFNLKRLGENSSIPYNVPLEEVAEKIEYLYTYEKMYCKVSASSRYEELNPLPEGKIWMTIYTAEGNKVLFLPEGTGNTEVLVKDELCKLYYSEEREGFLFYYISDFFVEEGGVPLYNMENGSWATEKFAICIMEGESQPISNSRYYTYYARFDSADLTKIGKIEVNLDAQRQISLQDIDVLGNEYIASMIKTAQSTLAEKEKYGDFEMYLGTYGRMPYDYDFTTTVFCASGCITGKDLEQYFFFGIYDASPTDSRIGAAYPDMPPTMEEWESGKYYFTGGNWLPAANPEERIQKIEEMERVKIPFTVNEGETYCVDRDNIACDDEKEHEKTEKIDFREMSSEEAADILSYVCSYSEWFGMNELGCPVGEVRGLREKELIMYTDSKDGEHLYFIPADKVNKAFMSEEGREYPMYINEEGYAELYSISGNPEAVKTEHLKTTLWSVNKMDKKLFEKYLRNYYLLGKGTLEIKNLPLLEVPKIETDEYVEALEGHIEELLTQAGKYGEYKIYIGEYESLDIDRVCLSAAVCGEEEYYVRYLITKSQTGKYYFWSAGFGLNGSLEECNGDRHYMNKVCIERTRQLNRREDTINIM